MATDERKDSKSPAIEPRRQPARPAARRTEQPASFWWEFPGAWYGNEAPFRGFAREIDRWFHDIGRPRRTPAGRPSDWQPAIESFQRGDDFVVRADLPGLKKDDITLHVTEEALTIEGERRSEQEERREGYYRTERSYGSFYRVISIPDGALPDTTRATFDNGVLEVVMKAPPKEVSRGRRIDIGGSDIYPE